ncbi:salivary C-type lectin 2-like [Glandiceps talaboti]
MYSGVTVICLCAIALVVADNSASSSSQEQTPVHSLEFPNDFACGCVRYDIYCEQAEDDTPYYQNAKSFCEANGGSLAILKTRKIDAKVRNAIVDHVNTSICIPSHGFWIGLSDSQTEGEFLWDDGLNTCPPEFTNWTPREPNNNTKLDTEHGQDCVQLWYRGNRKGKWDDEYCNERPKGIVCQRYVATCTPALAV